MTTDNIEDFYPLSPMQQGMLFHTLYAPETGTYFEQLTCTLRGNLQAAAFARAWQQVLDSHPILRTGFTGEGLKEPVQVVYRRVRLPLAQEDWRGLSRATQQLRLEGFLEAERRRGFVLSEPPLMRLALFRVSDDAHQLVWSHHHILLDGWSVPMLLQEVLACYEAFSNGRAAQLPPRRPYRDYLVWLRRQDLARAEAFWRATLKGFGAPTPLVVDRPRDCVASLPEQYAEQEIHLPAALTGKLQAFAREHHLTVSTLVHGAWAMLLSRYSGEDDVVFGSTVSGRPVDLPGSEAMIGLFINTLPVRVRLSRTLGAKDWLRALQAQLVEARQFEYSPLVDVQRLSDVPRGTPLFESLLVFENYPIADTLRQQSGSLVVEDVQAPETTNYPLNLVAGLAEELVLKIAYDRRRFDDAAVERMLGHLATVLEATATNPKSSLAELPYLTAEEWQQSVIEWNPAGWASAPDTTAHTLIEAAAERTPEAVALVFGPEQLTYGELNRRANRLAHDLVRRGVGPESLVGICIEPSFDLIVSVLAVLKAGAAFVPLDPAYPADRLAFMVEDSRTGLVLTHSDLLDRLPGVGVCLCVDRDGAAFAGARDANLAVPVDAANLAYVIYTSGSTGRPKGVLLQHGGLCNLVWALIEDFAIGAGSRVLQFSAFSFDAAIAEIFPTLVAGGTLVLAPREELRSVEDLRRLLREQRITTVTLPPSLLAILPADGLPDLRTVVSAGEACPAALAAIWTPGRRFVNGYGPTETPVGATDYHVDGKLPEGAEGVPIGRGIANVRVYLLDEELAPVAVGMLGEICIGGPGVARGYLGRPELTAQRFVPDPFSRLPGERLYRSGDLARFRSDGLLEFAGRCDNQVKLRGFRIELGEIEAALSEHPAVRQAVVVFQDAKNRGEAGDPRLVAFVVPRDEDQLPLDELRDHLLAALPAYMVPAVFVPLRTLPLTPNGKVDRRALPLPEQAGAGTRRGYVPPRDLFELRLIRLWEEVLNVHPIGARDDFFELGGHSLLAVRLVALLQRDFGRSIPLLTLFQNPTIENLAAIVRQTTGKTSLSCVVPLRARGTRPPWFFVHPSGGSVHWYLDLARHLDTDQPFYGLQALGVEGEAELDTRIEDMAARYIAAMRMVQPTGPYYLGSWSMGVIIAFEMAQQLRAQGQSVGLLALIDQGPFPPGPEPPDDAAYLCDLFDQHVEVSVEELRRLSFDEQVACILDRGRRTGWIYPDVTFEQFRGLIWIMKTEMQAWRRYVPSTYPGQITFFQAANPAGHTLAPRRASTLANAMVRRLGGRGAGLLRLLERLETGQSASAEPPDLNGVQQTDMGWSQLAAGVAIHVVPGDHLSLMHEPCVATLAEQLNHLRQA